MNPFQTGRSWLPVLAIVAALSAWLKVANADGEVRRSVEGGYGPLYQLSYMAGGLQFRALKEELVGSGKMTYRSFPDAVLHKTTFPSRWSVRSWQTRNCLGISRPAGDFTRFPERP